MDDDLPYDAALAGALNVHGGIEAARDNARVIGTYYKTLTEFGLEPQHAYDLTGQYAGFLWADLTSDDDEPDSDDPSDDGDDA